MHRISHQIVYFVCIKFVGVFSIYEKKYKSVFEGLARPAEFSNIFLLRSLNHQLNSSQKITGKVVSLQKSIFLENMLQNLNRLALMLIGKVKLVKQILK